MHITFLTHTVARTHTHTLDKQHFVMIAKQLPEISAQTQNIIERNEGSYKKET